MSEGSQKQSRRGSGSDPRPKRHRQKPVAPSIVSGPMSVELSRRHFLRAVGFSFVGAAIFGCGRAPEEAAIPFLEQPEGVIPGRADFYATTCGGCSAGCGILAKSRDGRPIKLEGNPQHPLSRGGLCPVGHASLLGLYDSKRFGGPLAGGEPSSWEQVDRELMDRFDDIRRRRAAVRVLTAEVTSPTKRDAIAAFLASFADARHVVYDPTSSWAILDAHERTHGLRALPRYHFERSRLIVSVDADFLGRWISPVSFTRDYSAGRRVSGSEETFSEHIQLESRMSITGSKADRRYKIAPGERALLLSHLAARVAERARMSFDGAGLAASPVGDAAVEEIARKLHEKRGRCLVVCGSDDVDSQVLCNFINQVLGNYGQTLDLARPSYQVQGSEAELTDLLEEISSGKVEALLVDGVNPFFDLPAGTALTQSLTQSLAAIPLLVSFAPRADETAQRAHYVCPDHHFLESWGDAEVAHGLVGFSQPLLNPLAQTRPVTESLSAWAGEPRSALELLQRRWGDDATWDHRIEEGFAEIERAPLPVGDFRFDRVRPVREAKRSPDASSGNTLALVLYTKVGMPNAAHAFNPWLQELPDPISKAVWDNYACLSPATAQRLGVLQEDVVALSITGTDGGADSTETLELPVLIQPGQHDGVVVVALGYGSELSRRFAGVGPQWLERKPTVTGEGLVGVNAVPLIQSVSGRRRFSGTAVQIRPVGRKYSLSLTQDYQSIDVPERLAPQGGLRRPNIQETTLAALLTAAAGRGAAEVAGAAENAGVAVAAEDTGAAEASREEHHRELWPDDHPYTGHHWGMAIDLTACTGCSACVTSCQVENNVPVVGKDEVGRNREMHWIRIDRYYIPQDEPRDVDVAHQPMMCHHCDNAPCETVCPVLATVHSDEGLNQQIYNRCVGTRYCSNNCPYKVRRFNWFGYAHEDERENLSLNPDVTVRSRGVMEKCSLCAQRIQEAKITAKEQGREVEDGEIQMACEQSCPASAIVFGDMNDPDSRLSKLIADGRHYRVLEEINVRPSVGYLQLVRNRPEPDGHEQHGREQHGREYHG